ncbi:uncharacterized protein [Watersipora subatra]|uniref:uncharacterized protein n=1 Tax=Watersipora subatra TaxID=2589382 RepID=UPI00355C748F
MGIVANLIDLVGRDDNESGSNCDGNYFTSGSDIDEEAGSSNDDEVLHLANTNFSSSLFDWTSLSLERLKRTGLKLKPSKCEFLQARDWHFGHIDGKEPVATHLKKTLAVWHWPNSRGLRKLQGFLGAVSYYQQCITGLAKTARPLNQLPSKGKVCFGPGETRGFDELKAMLSSAPVLGYPDLTLPYILDMDASNCRLGAVLSQGKEEADQVITYFSRH